MVVDREFAYILFICILFGALLLSFGCPWTPIPLIGPTLNSFWDLLESPWTTLGRLVAKGIAWVCPGAFSKLLTGLDIQLSSPQPAHKKLTSKGSSADHPQSNQFRQSRQSGARAAAPNLTSRASLLAPGARMT